MKFIFIFIILFIPAVVFSLEDKSDWPDTSAMHSVITQQEINGGKIEKANSLMTQALVNLIVYYPYKESSNDRGYPPELLQSQYEGWINYIDETCMTIGVMTGAGGSWPSYWGLKCKGNMLDQKIKNLTDIVNCTDRHIRNNRKDELPDCFYQGYSVYY